MVPGLAFAKTFDNGGPQPLVEGNIDLKARPIAAQTSISGRTPDTESTVLSMGIEIDGRQVLIPRVSGDGRILSEDEAVAEFMRTGRNLGVYRTIAEANAAAERIHRDQADLYGPNGLWGAKQPPQGPKDFTR
jgi:hypothetical protein